jgi:AbrB family looped-hinge helix DNA binding protein
MHQGSTAITRKGQLTIPIGVRARFGLQQGDRVDFFAEGDQIVMRRAESVVAKTAGSIKTTTPVLSARELREEAEDAIAEEALTRALP